VTYPDGLTITPLCYLPQDFEHGPSFTLGKMIGKVTSKAHALEEGLAAASLIDPLAVNFFNQAVLRR
jgi:hypothetical protein